MLKKIITILFFIISLIITILYFFKKTSDNYSDKKEVTEEISNYNSNIIKNVNYSSKDLNGNEYIINADQGEIDLSNTNIIYLTNVKGLIKLANGNSVRIKSKYGKYNINNYDTIFNIDVIVDYLDNNIIGQYLDVSINRNSLIMSKKVVYTNLDNILKADVIEMNIETKDTKIFMYNSEEKINIKSKK